MHGVMVRKRRISSAKGYMVIFFYHEQKEEKYGIT